MLSGSLIAWGVYFYYSKTQAVPDYGGEYIEGITGQPMHINSVLAQSNDTDADISQLIYSGLLKYDDDGNLINDLTERYDISEDKTEYTFYLRKNITWHDGTPLNASDVMFTINLISNPAFKSPLRSNWQGIETNIIDDYTISFKITNPYVGFLNNLTFGILPRHLWESLEPDRFSLNNLNLEPIGSGPYKYSSFQKDSQGNILSYKLVANPTYFAGKPFISKITFNFYQDEDSLIDAYNRKEVMGISGITPKKLDAIKLLQSTQAHKFNIPRYFAVFINQTKSIPLANDEVREALSYATNRDEIISKVLNGNGNPVFSPILPGMNGFSQALDKREFDLEKANKLLDDNGWTKGSDGFRAKDGINLEVNLTTTDWVELMETANELKSQWEKVGARVNVNVFPISDIQQNYIRPREYEALLFGQVLSGGPDLYSFWHTTQKKDPGLNLALFGDDETDKLIESGRNEFDKEKQAETYLEFQKKLQSEMPAVFLYSPYYIYPVNKKVQGVDIENLVSPSKRFSNINQWYINTDRVWK